MKSNDELEASIGKITWNTVPGLSIVVVRPDGVRWAGAFGLANLATRSPASEHTVYMWCSLTRLMTATCFSQLAESGRVALDDPVVSHYAPFQQLRPSRRMESVTIRHLLNHTSGLASSTPIAWIRRSGQPEPNPNAFLSKILAKHANLRTEPGSTVSDSNLNYLILGQIITSAAGQPFEDYVRRSVLAPLGMTRTDFVLSGEMSRLAATPYQKKWFFMSPSFRLALPQWVFGDRTDGFIALNRFYLNGAACRGLMGSAEDAAVFLRAHLNGGEVEGRRILSPQSIALMQNDGGLGWVRRTDQRDSDDYLEHVGSGGGFCSVMRLYPRSAVGVVIMGNSPFYDHNAILNLIADHWC